MIAFNEFCHMDPAFWAFIKFLSEMLGYTERKQGIVKSYTYEEVDNLCRKENVNTSHYIIESVVNYSRMRADLLNDFAQSMLMNAQDAAEEYRKWELLHQEEGFYCKIPLNKQKGEMKQVAYFTAIINIIAEKTFREVTSITDRIGFDDDPRGLTYMWDRERRIIGASSRRFDGAYPSVHSPEIVWEIKEYYYATTFGSRVADGVYETQLDGFEFKELYDRTGEKIYHVLFIDAYRTWWVQGKSYLCRLIDAMNSGVVDEVIVGREVLTRWPALFRSIIEDMYY